MAERLISGAVERGVRGFEERLTQSLAAMIEKSGGGPTPQSDKPWTDAGVLTEDEAIRYLRLDTIGIADPRATLRRYREQSLLRGTQVSKKVFYLRKELDAFLERLTERNPR